MTQEGRISRETARLSWVFKPWDIWTRAQRRRQQQRHVTRRTACVIPLAAQLTVKGADDGTILRGRARNTLAERGRSSPLAQEAFDYFTDRNGTSPELYKPCFGSLTSQILPFYSQGSGQDRAPNESTYHFKKFSVMKSHIWVYATVKRPTGSTGSG